MPVQPLSYLQFYFSLHNLMSFFILPSLWQISLFMRVVLSGVILSALHFPESKLILGNIMNKKVLIYDFIMLLPILKNSSEQL